MSVSLSRMRAFAATLRHMQADHYLLAGGASVGLGLGHHEPAAGAGADPGHDTNR